MSLVYMICQEMYTTGQALTLEATALEDGVAAGTTVITTVELVSLIMSIHLTDTVRTTEPEMLVFVWQGILTKRISF